MVMLYNCSYIEWSDTAADQYTFRENGPCLIHSAGTVYFAQLVSSSYNRPVGPAVIHPTGYVAFNTHADESINGAHRTNGPAIIYADGRKEYWVNDSPVPVEEYFLRFGVV